EFPGSTFCYGPTNALKPLDLVQRERRTANPTSFTIPHYTRAQFGSNLRGPIQRDKLFFAVSYEGQRIDDGINVVPAQPGVFDTSAGTFKAPTKNHTGVVRLTAVPSSTHTLDATWAGRYYNSETEFGSGASFGAIGAHN